VINVPFVFKQIAELVESFIEHHGGDSTIWNEGDESPTAPSASAHSDKDDTAAFLLEVGDFSFFLTQASIKRLNNLYQPSHLPRKTVIQPRFSRPFHTPISRWA
jgi:hypothetical protein